MKPIDRACLQYSVQVVIGIDQFYVTPDGKLVEKDRLTMVDPSGSVLDAVIATLSQMMKLHLLGSTLSKLWQKLSDTSQRATVPIHINVAGAVLMAGLAIHFSWGRWQLVLPAAAFAIVVLIFRRRFGS